MSDPDLERMQPINQPGIQTVNATYAYVGAFVDELQRSGLHNAVVCPGSRSTPLAMTLAMQAGIRVWMHIDERSAAFFALGLAKRLAQPVALLCSSGTAAANFLPAVVEAHLTHVPLLILTADRPSELHDCGAPQTIDQDHLYGTHVKWFVPVPLPEGTNEALRYIRTLANRACTLVQAAPAGPVHLNMPFREPLTPDPIVHQPLLAPELRDPIVWEGRPGNAPYITVSEAASGEVSSDVVKHIAEIASATEQGLIVVGPYVRLALLQPVVQLARQLGYPILADALSQLRSGEHERSLVLSSYDAFLRLSSFTAHMKPELILRFGAMPTSKPFLLYMQHHATSCRTIVIGDQDSWEEPTQLAAEMIHSDAALFCQRLLEHLEPRPSVSRWLAAWQQAEEITREALAATMLDFTQPFEGRVFYELNALLPTGTNLYVGNSMPVRDLDTFFWGSERAVRVMGNRGANGIDGVVSSALGFSAGAPQHESAVLVIGDLSFFHDLNGLLAARLHALHLTIVLLHNDGGGIFSFLPQAAHPEHFEQLFGTPTGLDFAPAVHMYGGRFQRATTWEQFRSAVWQGITEGGLHVVEVRTERESNVSMHRALWHAVDRALQAGKWR
jgi:2-succinyl-5-enolpyruvyl-6-hydroxy-3-cyclohexene-1-carboxylate synthase